MATALYLRKHWFKNLLEDLESNENLIALFDQYPVEKILEDILSTPYWSIDTEDIIINVVNEWLDEFYETESVIIAYDDDLIKLLKLLVLRFKQQLEHLKVKVETLVLYKIRGNICLFDTVSNVYCKG